MVKDELYSLLCNDQNRTAEHVKHLPTFRSYCELTCQGSTSHHSIA